MATAIEILTHNRSQIDIDLATVADVARRALEALGYDRGELGVIFVDRAEIARLNHEHLGREGATDVISFPIDSSPEDVPGTDVPLLLGDVVISPEVARENCENYGTGFSAEICRLALHGILHIAGFDHESDDGEMQSREDGLVDDLCGGR